ncbi:amylo-alpha-1,6-glucosidase [Desulfobacula toluolica]|uniref:Amylo-alpha-1,6-glucosidase n=1 Tax=Desulfobacula toluolica (strain DSM 7467 / Tol2) TaxID=651182 RepID=K0NPA9_DESTT|nr:amylo-alpha-1,6-glucosidase [Desulfobacula toluolica]CCK80642.1 amylo-alpha-1,6-glucosidase [Desulfobacula toluolica Tol2]
MEKTGMETQLYLTQSPFPGESRVMYCGDCVTFTLTLSAEVKGKAWVRTNLGSAVVARKEIISRVERDEIKLDEAWVDIQMKQENGLMYKIVLPLHQTGFFQAKCFFTPENSTRPVWPPGDNCIFNVEPAGTCCANIIYNAFVRQFGRSKSGVAEEKDMSPIINTLDANGYTVIPESGKFRDLKKQVEFIFSRLGCRVLHLLPIHPTPTTYARMGRFGSPYAALNFTDVDPALAEFDPSATPLEQFMELVDTVHLHNGYLFMDIAINHTGWAASIHETNPEWLVRGKDGKIEAPGAWGVVWSDLTKLDYSNRDLWKYMADVFLLWCHRGVDGFRCDAGYMIPVEAWEYIVAKVRGEYPEILFFLEGLGGPIKTTCEILGKANFNFAYSELFQNHTRQEISDYLPRAYEISNTCGHMIHFAETHDNNRLASVSIRYAKMRTSLCALFSVCGGFGFANGVEWFATQKIDVHESGSLNWGNQTNQVDHISRLNLILKHHPTCFAQTRLELIQQNQSECLVLLRYNEKKNKKLLVLVNLDCENSNEASWLRKDADMNTTLLYDLISGTQIKIEKIDENSCVMKLAPGEVLALTPDSDDMKILEQYSGIKSRAPERVYLQKLKTKVLAIHTIFHGYKNVNKSHIEHEAVSFANDPVEFIRSFNQDSQESRVIVFDWEKDLNRQLMIPPGFFLLVKCRVGFRAEILDEKTSVKTSLGYEEGIPTYDGKSFFALFFPKKTKRKHKKYILRLRVFEPAGTRIENTSLLYLARCDALYMRSSFTRKEIVKTPFLKLLAATKKGGMMRAAAWWGRLDSRYDALLGANIDATRPENRWMVLSRCRIWGVFQGYSRELAPDCLEEFTFSYDHGGKWRFHVPTSEGKYYALQLYLAIDPEENHVCLSIVRVASPENNPFFLDDDKKVTLIIRPDIEDRSFHETVKAFKGPEIEWPKAVSPLENGFNFFLANGKILRLAVSKGEFVHEPEWHYMIHHSLEAQRGLDAESDLFSPGYFTLSCLGGEQVQLNAAVSEKPNGEKPNLEIGFNKIITDSESKKFVKGMLFSEAVYKSLDAFVVDRGTDKSVIAGYPWFLDWGRDSLIFCRSLIELGRFSDAKAILRLFGRFENKGTLPNMICGDNAANIETSDAPLWFFACCRDLIEKENSHDFLTQKLDNRTVKDVLLSIAHSLLKGTQTGVVADPDTRLLYSPSHFTWMDTNFPAGSPRQGYPIEIQALWYNALVLLASIDGSNKTDWLKKAGTVKKAVQDLFYNKASGYFSDCLHCNGPVGAKNALADDALRPNQLFLVTFDVIQDKHIAQRCVEACQELLVPGAIRSLANRRVEIPIPVFYGGKLINDPHFPYAGQYKGDEDTQRKPAYHNGTAWTWQFPVFCEAWSIVFGKNSFSTCLAWLGSVIDLMRKGSAGYIPEILDGDFPHTPRGCDAQAWGTSEVARVMHKLLH